MNRFACLYIPQRDSIVITCTRQQLPIRAERYVCGFILMSLHRPKFSASSDGSLARFRVMLALKVSKSTDVLGTVLEQLTLALKASGQKALGDGTEASGQEVEVVSTEGAA